MHSEEGKTAFLRSFFLKNPILVRAIGIGPVIAAAYTLKAGVAISIIMFMLLAGSCFFGYFAGGRIPGVLFAPVHIVVSAVLLIPSYLAVNAMMPREIGALGVFAPLLMVNSILASYAPESDLKGLRYAACDMAGSAVGFSFVTLLISAVREIMVSGTIWGFTVQNTFEIPGMKRPFAGFILLAFAAALGKHMRIRFSERRNKNGGIYY